MSNVKPKKIKAIISKPKKAGSDAHADDTKENELKECGFCVPNEIHLTTQDAKKYFDVDDQTVLSKLRFTDVSLYSTTPTNQAEYTAKLLLNYYSTDDLKTKVLTDATACIGGNTWIFADYVKQVQANELSDLHFEILTHNLKVLKKNNVSLTKENYLSNYLTLKQDIVFFDPPWGGSDYKSRDEMDIYLIAPDKTRVSLDKIVNGLLSYQCETLVLKLPVNYGVKKIINRTQFVNVDDLVIYADPDGLPLYRIVILSHLPRLTMPKAEKFPRLRYKNIIPV